MAPRFYAALHLDPEQIVCHEVHGLFYYIHMLTDSIYLKSSDHLNVVLFFGDCTAFATSESEVSQFSLISYNICRRS